MNKIMQGVRKLLGILLMAAGCLIFFYPDISSAWQEHQTKSYIESFEEKRQEEKQEHAKNQLSEPIEKESEGGSPEADLILKETDPLYLKMLSYNESLIETGQAGFSDAWIITQVPEELDGFDLSEAGYIEIPKMDVTLPLYIGASTENMAKGAVVLGQTSMPIGGESTNCVIAGHRGYRGAAFFREIEELTIGDMVYITNLWETLCYCVTSICIIDPYDSEELLIRGGKDMVTLVTCHPYRSHGKYRYIVYCERQEDEKETLSPKEEVTESERVTESAGIEDVPTAAYGASYESSKKDIQTEWYLRRGAALVILVLFIITTKKRGKE